MTDTVALRKTIFSSELSFSEKEELAWLFADATDEEVGAAEKLFAEDVSWVKRLSDNYQQKKLAFLTDDVELWKQILAEEKSYVAA